MQDYLGAELGFYFSWVSFYTRYLWAPAVLGLVTYIAQTQLELRISDALLASNATSGVELGSGSSSSEGEGEGDGEGDGDGIIGLFFSSNATASGAPSPERVAKESLTALYALFMSVWAALFVERWKRRAKLPLTLALTLALALAPTLTLTLPLTRRAKLLCLDWDVIGQGAR